MGLAYYNENDPFCVEWLRALILMGCIAPGDVDNRSIEDVTPNDLKGYKQCHFFAGIGTWSYALRNAGWPDDRAVWTGSCPCQPFSAAGKGKGADDERHLWPDWRWLIDQCRPANIFGEQVASKAGRAWGAGVRSDLEAMAYGVGLADLCAAGVGAPHIRQRLFWMGNANGERARRNTGTIPGAQAQGDCQREQDGRLSDGVINAGTTSRVPDTDGRQSREAGEIQSGRKHRLQSQSRSDVRQSSERSRFEAGRIPDTNDPRSQGRGLLCERAGQLSAWSSSLDNWLPCADGKARRIEPGLEPLVNGAAARVGRLRGYGNGIVEPLARTFIEEVMELVA